jgi:hypothetical protein
MYNHITPTEVGDRMNFCNPLAISRKVAMIKLHAMAAEDGERFDALEEAGFKLDRFGDIISVLYDKLGGHYVDVGTSAKISKGLVSHIYYELRHFRCHCVVSLVTDDNFLSK